MLRSTSVVSWVDVIKDIVVRDAGGRGKGVFALRDFRKGEFIFHGYPLPWRRGTGSPVRALAELSE